MSELDRFVRLYIVLTLVLNGWVLFLGETRWDVYVVLNILSFYISYAMNRPSFENRRVVGVLHGILITLFIALVSYRVYEVLAS
ncbi:hypothetical protein TCELL_0441 [Thermogladius calderae 1633]|uniref:Uncharacterized protein n=1 Tax=Thermogladius calderae (strain DSM 22663 / VKM B-2946 / 1633) TaxID=1184251 RepID=I3TDM8_THEC1|nr:hypothetical protein [Thermogladius calderae]AFK50866.1 hypothetical protein TCELL_0441 [Thermogladius calderae 1633]